MTYRQHYQTRQTPQSQPIPGKDMVANSAGGFSFAVDDWKRLDRFLILGTTGGTYYIGEKTLTVENAEAVRRCITEDSQRVVNRIVEISQSGRAPKNDPALFALAMCAGLGDLNTRKAALAALSQVARIGTHLFHFLEYVEGFRGWGRTLKQAVANWYTDKPLKDLAYQAIKYQQRDGWSHRDALRLSHPDSDDPARKALYNYITKGEGDITSWNALDLIEGFERAKYADNKAQVVGLINTCGLTREMIPTQWLNEPEVWAALLEKMPLTAMVRNLGKMTEIGLIRSMSQAAGLVTERLNDQEWLKRSRVHPLSILIALRTYQKGHGLRGSLKWQPVSQVVDALDEAFYLSFGNVEPTGKRFMLALDVSGSMSFYNIAGMPITPREASAAMALITARVEPNYQIMAFSHKLVPVTISPRQRLDDAISTVSHMDFGGTDCALPMIKALDDGLEVDVFTVYTDNETWAGVMHPAQALQRYRERMNIAAKLAVVGMVSNGFSIADPDDSGMIDVVGFDTATPQVLSDFAAE